MRKLLTLLVLLAFGSDLLAEISVKSFRKLENDLSARINPTKDQNGENCAIIKIVTTQKGFSWEPDGLGITKVESKIGEYWLYIPHGAKRITIKHPQLGLLRDYFYTIPIEQSTVYELVLISGQVETTVTETIGSEWIVITSEPAGAEVFIDNKATGEFTPFSRQFEYGTHTYRLGFDNYHPDAGKFELSQEGGKKKIISKLLPNFGGLKLISLPEDGATIFLDGKQLNQTTPSTIPILKSGTHNISLKKQMFHDYSESIVINDGQITIKEINLQPAYGSISIKSTPEDGAAVILDNEPTGQKTPCVIEKVSSGMHDIKLQKEWYQTASEKLNIKDGELKTIDIGLNAVYGTLNISASPDVEIYIDNEKRSVGSVTCRLHEGVYTIDARKFKYTTDSRKVQISTGENKSITLTPRPQYGVLEIQSSPIDAAILINGVDKGTTPVTLSNLLVDDYQLTLSLPNHITVNKTVSVKENQTTKINEILKETSVSIKSFPSGASINIDGVSYGTTPNNTINLPQGTYSLILSLPNYNAISKNISISEGQVLNISETMIKRKSITITSNPTGANLQVDGKYIGMTPCEIPEFTSGSKYVYLYYGNMNIHQYIFPSHEDNRVINFSLSTEKQIRSEKRPKTEKTTIRYIGINAAMPLINKAENNNVYAYESFFGIVKTVGVYAKIISNGSDGQMDYTVNTLPKSYYYQGNTSSTNSVFTRMGAVGGLLFNANPILFYLGGGWGYYYNTYTVSLYNYSDDSFMKTITLGDKYSIEGIESNAGIILKTGRIGFTLGVSSIGFKYYEGNCGIGLFF